MYGDDWPNDLLPVFCEFAAAALLLRNGQRYDRVSIVMTQHSGFELNPSSATAAELPLSERPLVADEQSGVDEQNTVVKSGPDTQPVPAEEIPLSASAQEIRDRLFTPHDSMPHAERGLRIDHFEIQERIGSGGMGAVFRAVDLNLSRHVALKILHPGVAADPGLVARFRNEARACAQLNHDNIARVFFSGEQEGVNYIAYEFADGRTIKELIASHGRLSVEDTINYAIQTTLALNHINAAGIVHRDIKPSNIILTRNDRIKVVDLGLARRDTTDSIGDLTVAGTTLGTFDYIAPEQARDPRTADIRSDIYSLGCTLYHMLTGQPPYPEGTALQKLLDHQGKSPPDPRELNAAVPPEVSFIVQKMMNTDAVQRYQDPGQMLADLISLAGQLGLHSVPAEGIVWRRVPVRKVRELSGSLLLTLGVLVICVTALVMHFTPNNDTGVVANDAPTPEFVAQADNPDSKPEVATPLFPETEPPDESDVNSVRETRTTSPDVPPPQKGMGPPETMNPGSPSDNVKGVPGSFQLVSPDKSSARFPNLSQAWDAAKSGDRIIFDFDGPLFVNALPKSGVVDSRSIELRAARGRRPLLEFRADSTNSARDRQLFYLSNDLKLTIVGIDLRLDVPEIEGPSDPWVLFECHGPNQVTLQDSTIEIENPSRQSAAVVRLSDGTGETVDETRSVVRLSKVAVRGSCDLARIATQASGRIEASDCGFALDGSLIHSVGSPDNNRDPGQIDVRLEHTTSILARSAFRTVDSDLLNGGSQERIVPGLNVMAHSNVFASLSPTGRLVQSQGNAYLEELEDLLRWNGSHNLYFQYGTYWELESGTYDRDSDAYSFSEWNRHWRATQGDRAAAAREFDSSLWSHPELLRGKTRADLSRMATLAFELDGTFFYPSGSDSPGMFSLDSEGLVPGVKSEELRTFPAGPMKSPQKSSPVKKLLQKNAG